MHPDQLTEEDSRRLRSAGRGIVEELTGRTLGKKPADFEPPAFISPVTLEGKPIPPRRWIVPDWLPVGSVTLHYADGGTGKTLMAQQLMTSCATGTPWCGLAVRQCKVLGIFCEDDEDELHRRQADICNTYGVRFDELSDMRWTSRVGADNLLMTFTSEGRGELTALFDAIAKEAQTFGAELVVIDTAADTFGGNENDRNQVRQYLNSALTRLARMIGGAVLVNAHPSRSGLAAGGSMDSGSTGWSNSARSRWSLERPTGEDGFPDLKSPERILTRRKANYSSIGDTIRLKWVRGVLLPADVVRRGFDGGNDILHVEHVFLTLLDRCIEQGVYLSHSKNSSGNYAPKIMAKRPDREGLALKDFEGAMHRLFEQRRIKAGKHRTAARKLRDCIVISADDDDDSEDGLEEVLAMETGSEKGAPGAPGSP